MSSTSQAMPHKDLRWVFPQKYLRVNILLDFPVLFLQSALPHTRLQSSSHLWPEVILKQFLSRESLDDNSLSPSSVPSTPLQPLQFLLSPLSYSSIDPQILLRSSSDLSHPAWLLLSPLCSNLALPQQFLSPSPLQSLSSAPQQAIP